MADDEYFFSFRSMILFNVSKITTKWKKTRINWMLTEIHEDNDERNSFIVFFFIFLLLLKSGTIWITWKKSKKKSVFPFKFVLTIAIKWTKRNMKIERKKPISMNTSVPIFFLFFLSQFCRLKIFQAKFPFLFFALFTLEMIRFYFISFCICAERNLIFY